MSWIARTLWDLLESASAPADLRAPRPVRGTRSSPRSPVSVRVPVATRYEALVRDMKARYGIRVRKWRSSTSGCAWEVHYHDGRTVRLVEAPYPRGPMSCAIFLHEVGHHAIGFGRFRPRCLEEYHAWRWALETMETCGFNVTAHVRKRMADSLRYAVSKAQRRGLRRVPPELESFLNHTFTPRVSSRPESVAMRERR